MLLKFQVMLFAKASSAFMTAASGGGWQVCGGRTGSGAPARGRSEGFFGSYGEIVSAQSVEF